MMWTSPVVALWVSEGPKHYRYNFNEYYPHWNETKACWKSAKFPFERVEYSRVQVKLWRPQSMLRNVLVAKGFVQEGIAESIIWRVSRRAGQSAIPDSHFCRPERNHPNGERRSASPSLMGIDSRCGNMQTVGKDLFGINSTSPRIDGGLVSAVRANADVKVSLMFSWKPLPNECDLNATAYLRIDVIVWPTYL